MPIKPFNMDNYRDQVNLTDKDYTDWHSVNTIIFGSLLESGFDWGRDKWTSYTTEPEVLEVIRPRLNKKLEERFFFREIGVEEPGRFAFYLRRRLTTSVDSMGPIYNELTDGIDFSVKGSEISEELTENSQFPQQAIKDGYDYLSDSSRVRSEKISSMGQLEIFDEFSNFTEPDNRVLDYLEDCFSNYAN